MASSLKIDIGDRFGNLVIVKELERFRTISGKSRRVFDLCCDCGNPCTKTLSNLTNPKYSKHCGCQNRKKRTPSVRSVSDLTGQRFGQVLVLKTIPENWVNGVRTRVSCECLCDCGAITIKYAAELKRLGRRTRYKQTFVNCGDTHKHLVGPTYPPTPKDYPLDAWDIVRDYQSRLLSPFERERGITDGCVEDVRAWQLERVAWIITYRRSQGEKIDRNKERAIIFKYFRHAKYVQSSRYWRTIDSSKIGGNMTDSKMTVEQAVELLADFSCASESPKKSKRFIRR